MIATPSVSTWPLSSLSAGTAPFELTAKKSEPSSSFLVLVSARLRSRLMPASRAVMWEASEQAPGAKYNCMTYSISLV